MSRNASGNYTLPAGNPVVTNTTISSSWGNTTLNDLAAEITDSLDRSGKGGMLAALALTDGTSGAPALSFSNELSTGLYRAGASDIRLAVGATDRIIARSGTGNTALEFSSNQIASEVQDAFRFNTTITRTAGNLLTVANNGSYRFRVNSFGDTGWGAGLSSGSATTLVSEAVDGGLIISGTRAAGSATSDIAINSSITRTAGKLLSITNNVIEKAYVDYNGLLSAQSFWAFGAISATLKGQVSDGASAVGVILDNNINLANATAKLASIRNAGVEKAYFQKDGDLHLGGNAYADILYAQNAVSVSVRGQVADGASAVGVILDNVNALANVTAKVVSFRQGGAEVGWLDRGGTLGLNNDVRLGGTSVLTTQAAATVTVKGNPTDGASAVGVALDTPTLANATSKLVSVRNAGAEKASINKDGVYVGPTSSSPILIVDTSVTSIPTGTTRTIVVFTNVLSDSDSGYNSGTGRYTVPSGKGGVYMVTAVIHWVNYNSSPLYIEIWKNAAFHRTKRTGNSDHYMSISCPVILAAGDIIDIRVAHNDVASQALGNPSGAAGSTASYNWFTLQRVGL